jgi:structural maintenance of chromosome 2
MHIQEIIVDGFKSYAARTVIAGFDPHFNAITGLNGSGKSNILDAICFVLGITNLSQVRAGNLQELVYKQGQAGVTKATVTIVFDNTDSSQSPIGYEQFSQITVTRQIVIGGRNKYMINGHTAQATQVQNLFHSVQLNVNNPHFLIMQGRITKVLNMKPMEILGMIEEAAGTRMFENKKQSAIATIEKKQAKVQEINRVLADDITPTLERLQGERGQYLEWSSNNAEVERLERFCVAYRFLEMERKADPESDEKSSLEDELEASLRQAQAMDTRMADIDASMESIASTRDGEMEERFYNAKVEEEAAGKEVVRLNTVCENKRDTLKQEEDNVQTLEEQAEELERSLEAKVQEFEEYKQSMAETEQSVNEKEAEWKSLQATFRNFSTGLVDQSEDNAAFQSLPEKIASYQSKVQGHKNAFQQAELRANHMRATLEEVRSSIQGTEREQQQQQKALEKIQRDLGKIEARMESLGYSEQEEEQIIREMNDLEAEVNVLRNKERRLAAKLAGRLTFEFSDPERGFDRSRVKGIVANLIDLPDTDMASAIEVVAGNRLYNVIVDTERTAKAVMERGQLRKRVTIIPLNKIARRTVSSSVLSRVEEKTEEIGGRASLAIELIGFDDEVRHAMEHIFGSTFVCDNADLARAVAFTPGIKTKAVTVDGDVFDPSGTLTGGHSRNTGVILTKLQELRGFQVTLREMEGRLMELQGQLNALREKSAQFLELQSTYQMKEHEMNRLQRAINSSTHGESMRRIQDLETKIEQEEATVQHERILFTDAQQDLEQLKEQEENFRNKRDEEMDSLKEQVEAAKQAFIEMRDAIKDSRRQREVFTLEIRSLETEGVALREQIEEAREIVEGVKSKIEELMAELAEVEQVYDEKKGTLEEVKQELASCSSQMSKLEREKSACENRREEAVLQQKALRKSLSQLDGEIDHAKKAVRQMLKKYAWISTEKEFFGREGTDFDFDSVDSMEETEGRLTELRERQRTLGRKINKKVMGMLEKAEGEYDTLMRKRETIENDKTKIERVIEELDVKKNQALHTTWTKVNRDFGSIFSTLLPGTSAKLAPANDAEVLDCGEGLEVKVAFGNVWKESLTELSGGQRSLLALSLILSLLLFKPAPMYILDEVDAALDLSHTQNIGTMLKTHFSQSQFIVVSLKEGMFNNANVLFKTKFVEGRSTVTRIDNTTSSSSSSSSSSSENPSSFTTFARSNGRRNKRSMQDEEEEEEEVKGQENEEEEEEGSDGEYEEEEEDSRPLKKTKRNGGRSRRRVLSDRNANEAVEA